LKGEKGENIVAVECQRIPALETKRLGMIITLKPGEIHFGVFMLRGADVLSVSDQQIRDVDALTDAEIALLADDSPMHDIKSFAVNPFILDKCDVTIFAIVRHKNGLRVTLDDGLKWFECSSISSLSVGHAGFFRLGFKDGGICIRSHS
jgi:hypothetical protein